MEEKGKTWKFIKGGIMLWVLLIIISFLIHFSTSGLIENETDNLLSGLNAMIFIFGICGIPIILFFSVLLKLFQKGIDKIPTKEEDKKS